MTDRTTYWGSVRYLPQGKHHDAEFLLNYRFGLGAAATEPAAIDYTDQAKTGVVGDGCSAHYTPSPESESMLICGYVDRILQSIPKHHREVLTLAYGPAGQIATEGGASPAKRWRAVCSMAPSLLPWAKSWAEHRANRKEHGPLCERYMSHLQAKLEDPDKGLNREERFRWETVRKESLDLLHGAQVVWSEAVKRER